MPYITQLDTPKEKTKYLYDLFKETYIKVIVERNNLRDDDSIENIFVLNMIALLNFEFNNRNS